MKAQLGDMKVSTISEAQEELSYRRRSQPSMIHSVSNEYPHLRIRSVGLKDYISEARFKARRPTNYRAKYG